jgi:hypothetical protein
MQRGKSEQNGQLRHGDEEGFFQTEEKKLRRGVAWLSEIFHEKCISPMY